MAHSHWGCQSPRDYFTEQLLTILVCGGLGFVGVSMYLNGMLIHILAPQFHSAVLAGSIAVLVLIVIRAIVVWREAGTLQAADTMNCQENHVHTAACNHLPGLPGSDIASDDHGHSHDLSWVFTRMLILAFPILLYAFGIPNSGFSMEWQLRKAGNDVALDPETLKKLAEESARPSDKLTIEPDGTRIQVLVHPTGMEIKEITTPNGEVKYIPLPGAGEEMRFNTLNEAAYDPDKRKAYSGQTAIMEGRFKRLDDKEFTLFRLKMTCCGADTVPLKVRIIAPLAVNGFNDFDWVRVKGVIQFIKAPGQDRYTPVLVLGGIGEDDIRRVEVRNEYEF